MNIKSKKRLIIIIFIVVLIPLLYYFTFVKGNSSVVRLETVKAEKGSISSAITATGTVEPITSVDIGTQVSGIISKIYVDYNSVVKKGDVLAELDKTLLQAELQSASATLQSQKVTLENEERTYKRQKMLWDKQAISRADWETAETSYQKAQLAVVAAEVALKRAKDNLGYATIYSSIDGVVISKAVSEGQTVASSYSTPTLFTIVNDLTKMQVIANVDEADIGGVKEGQRATFTVDAFPDDIFSGTVSQVRLEATTTSNVVTYQVVIQTSNPHLKLKPGMTASASIYTIEENDVLTLPSKAFRFYPTVEELKKVKDLEIDAGASDTEVVPNDSNTKTVWLKKGNKVTPRQVVIGATDGIHVVIDEGLNEGDEVAYALTEEQPQKEDKNTSSSPFMPKRPGGDKKK